MGLRDEEVSWLLAGSHDVGWYAYEGVVLPGALERPCLVGPRNETLEDDVGPFGESRDEQVDRPLWRAIDNGMIAPSRESEDDDDIGPSGESRDDEEVGPFGESRAEDKGLRQGHHEEEKEEEKEECGSPENMTELMQLAAKSVGIMSGVPADTGDASSSRTATILPTETQAPLTSPHPPLASTRSTPSKKRARDWEDDAKDEEFPSQQKRMRMDGILGIVRKDANAAEIPQNVEAVMTSEIQQSRKRARSPEDDSEDGETKPTRKRLRLYQQIEEVRESDEEYITGGQTDVANNGESTLVYQDSSRCETQEIAKVEKDATRMHFHKRPSVEDESPTNEEEALGQETPSEETALPAEEEWDTAHGINSKCANIRVSGQGVWTVIGKWRNLYLPTSTGLPDRPWTEEEKEDLRAYVQDYKIGNWALLSRSTNRPEEELGDMYREVVTARNIQAGRPERAGIPERDSHSAPPPEPRKLRSRSQKGKKAKKNNFGDLTYDVKATSFPKITKDGGMVNANGDTLLGIMGDISSATKRRQPKPKQEDASSSFGGAEDSKNHESSKAEMEDGSGSEIEEGEVIESAERSREQGPSPSPSPSPSPEPMSRTGPLNASVEGEEEDPNAKQDDPDQGQQVPTPPTSEVKTTSARGPLGPKFAGVCKLSGSSRRGVPRNAAGLRKRSPE